MIPLTEFINQGNEPETVESTAMIDSPWEPQRSKQYITRADIPTQRSTHLKSDTNNFKLVKECQFKNRNRKST